jgi:CDP-diacylglycerol--inositol 3-phosphatidyltransferase
MTIPDSIAWACSPFMLAKQVLNLMQLMRASKLLADGDREIRKVAGLSRKKMQ